MRTKLTPMEKAKGEIRKLVTALHQEIYNLRWNEGEKGELALSYLADEYETIARHATEAGIPAQGWSGGIINHAEFASAMVKLMTDPS